VGLCDDVRLCLLDDLTSLLLGSLLSSINFLNFFLSMIFFIFFPFQDGGGFFFSYHFFYVSPYQFSESAHSGNINMYGYRVENWN
jgi:hypothetical protein